MPNWREEYLTSLRDAELQNPVNQELVQTCSQLADRISALEAEKAVLQSRRVFSNTHPRNNTDDDDPTPPKAGSFSPSPPPAQPTTTTTTAAAAAAAAAAADDPSVAQLRSDLAESLRSKGVTDSRLRAAEEELSKLRARARDDARSLRDLATERGLLTTRLKDREHELREKRKLLEQVQDEMITLNLQLAVAEKERDKVKRENKELVERWMTRMAQEADAMNLANEPLFDR
ncbi:hypothetical protein E4U41_001965 [Claviceps citrina]|nr:hypothetical protein E4U41_001965 [Claviceps citrina]